MPAPRKFDNETRARTVRLDRDGVEEHADSKVEARSQVGALLDINPATIRNWVKAEERAAGSRPAISRQAEAEEVRALKRRVAELERANEILKTASAFSRRRSSTADCGDRHAHQRFP
jgi:transposase